MNCDELKRHLYDYFEHKLSKAEREALDAHAASCAACGDVLREAGELTCRELAEFLNDYVDGSLPTERREVFERHLRMCPPCIDFLESYKRTIELTGDACGPCDEDAPEVPEALVRAILEARARDAGS